MRDPEGREKEFRVRGQVWSLQQAGVQGAQKGQHMVTGARGRHGLILTVLGRPQGVSHLPGSRLAGKTPLLAVAMWKCPEQFLCQCSRGQSLSLSPV